MGTYPFAKSRLQLVRQLRDVLTAEWNAELAVFVVTELELSARKYQKLRLALCKAHDEFWRKRAWYCCPVTNQVVWMPEPLVPHHVWKKRMKDKLPPHNLQISDDGKISQRAFIPTLQQTMARDAQHLRTFSEADPAMPCFGIDHATISRVREFSHGGLTMGGCYRGDAPISEMKHVTLVVGQYHDDAKGLDKMLGPQEGVVGIAAEFAALDASQQLEFQGETVPCVPKICLDLAAARGMRKCRSKAACLCDCRELRNLQKFPGQLDPPIPSLPDGDTEADWARACEIAEGQCSYGSEKMEYPSLRAAAHLLPEGWDFERDGPWKCSWCLKVIWTAPGQFEADKARLDKLAEAAKSDKIAKKALNDELKEHADVHADTLKYEDQVIKVGTNRYVVDPLHCLLLNLGKTAWKYSFGDVMDPDQREQVAAYLTTINLFLDIREKGKREQSQKWFSGAQFDDFVVGVLHGASRSKSPGLVRNILAIVELVYPPPPPPAPANPQPAAAPPKKATSRKDRHGGPPPAPQPAPQAQPATLPADDAVRAFSPADLEALDDHDSYSSRATEVAAYIRQRHSNNASRVLWVLRLWEAYGRLYSAWRDKWTSRSREYRRTRCLRFARAARDFAEALKSVSNSNHKSWYVHLVVWIVWRQMMECCDTWQLSTVAIETRGARIKRYGRTLVSWRPLCQGFTVYKYINRATGQLREGLRTYSSTNHPPCIRSLNAWSCQRRVGIRMPASTDQSASACARHFSLSS